MKELLKKIYAVAICFNIMAGVCLFAQTGLSEQGENKKQQQEQDGKTTSESGDSEAEVVKKARDHDVEEGETIQPVDSKSMPVKETRLSKLREKDSAKGESSHKSLVEQARNRQQSSLMELNKSIIQGDNKIIEAKTKIRDAEIKLDSDKRALRITEAALNEKKEALAHAEKAVNELEIKVTKAKEFKMALIESSSKIAE